MKEREEKQAPEVVTPLRSIQTTDGGEARLECQIRGSPKPTVTWYKEDQVMVNSEEFKIFYDDDNLCSLVIPDVYPEDAGKYTVVAKNELGTAETTAELFVAGKRCHIPLVSFGMFLCLSSKKLGNDSHMVVILTKFQLQMRFWRMNT